MKLWDIDLVTFALAVISVWPQNHSCLPASPFCPYPRAIFPPPFFSFRFTPSQSCLRCPPNSSSTACATFDLATTFHVASNDCRWLLFAADSKFSLGFFLSACYALSLSLFLFPPHPAQISKKDDINKNICYRPFFFSFLFPWFSSWDVFKSIIQSIHEIERLETCTHNGCFSGKSVWHDNLFVCNRDCHSLWFIQSVNLSLSLVMSHRCIR